MATTTETARYKYPVLDSFIYKGKPYTKGGEPIVLTKAEAEPLIKAKTIKNSSVVAPKTKQGAK